MKIPRKMFQEGIELCKKNVLDYLNEAEMMAQKGSLHHAYVSVQLAIEETGKALWLKDELQKNPNDPVNVPDVVFGINGNKSHKLKFERASKVLNQDMLWVCKGPFDRDIFNPRVFNVGREASPETRLLNAYVKFDEKAQKWYIGCDIDSSILNALIKNVEEVVSTL